MNSCNRHAKDVSGKFSKAMPRRDFLKVGTAGLAGMLLSQTGCRSTGGTRSTSAEKPILAFNTANLVARYTGYRFELKNWGKQHQLTVAQTDEKAWNSICRDIAATGFRTVEIWEAHAAPETLNASRAAIWKKILQDHGLTPIAYAGQLRPETLQICQWLGIPHVDGGIGGLSPDKAIQLCQQYGIHFNLENHPEKTAEEILKPLGGGNEWLGVCIDTGWLGTQGVSAPEVIRACAPFVRHTHIKDVKHAGSHETCPLGEGVVNVPACLQALKEIGYTGVYSWEDEPEDRNPFDSAERNLKWLKKHVV